MAVSNGDMGFMVPFRRISNQRNEEFIEANVMISCCDDLSLSVISSSHENSVFYTVDDTLSEALSLHR